MSEAFGARSFYGWLAGLIILANGHRQQEQEQDVLCSGPACKVHLPPGDAYTEDRLTSHVPGPSSRPTVLPASP